MVSTNANSIALAMESESNSEKAESIQVIDNEEILDRFNMNESDVVEASETRDNFTDQTDESQIFSIEQVNLTKIEFQQKYGSEDKYVLAEECGTFRSEVNGARGIIKLIDTETGNTDTINYFETLDKLNRENTQVIRSVSRPGAWKTQGPDKANLSVTKGSEKDTLKASNPVTGLVKTYTKNTNDWYSGYTKGYYDNIGNARKSWGTGKSFAGASASAAFTAIGANFVKQQQWWSSQDKFVTAFRTMAAGAAVYNIYEAARYGVAYLANMGVVFNNYSKL